MLLTHLALALISPLDKQPISPWKQNRKKGESDLIAV